MGTRLGTRPGRDRSRQKILKFLWIRTIIDIRSPWQCNSRILQVVISWKWERTCGRLQQYTMVVLTATFLFYLFLSVWMNLYGKVVPLMSLVKINQLLRNTTLPWALRFTRPRIKVIAVSLSLQYTIWKWQWRALLSVASRVFVCHYLGPQLPHNLEAKPVAQLVSQATPFTERGRVWSRCNYRVVTEERNYRT